MALLLGHADVTPNSKMFADYRIQINGHEAVQLPDEVKQEILERKVLSARLPVSWLGYGERPEVGLEHLYRAGLKKQWRPEGLLHLRDTSLFALNERFAAPDDELALGEILKMFGKSGEAQEADFFEIHDLLSNVLPGERAAWDIAASLARSGPTHRIKLCATVQALDESRHVETIAQLLQRKFGGIGPPAPGIKYLFDGLLEVEDSAEMLLGMHLVLEGYALGFFEQLRNSSNPCVSELFGYIFRDEARHHRFGVMALRELQKQDLLGEGQIPQFLEWMRYIMDGFNSARILGWAEFFGNKYNLDPADLVRVITNHPNWREINIHLHRYIRAAVHRLGWQRYLLPKTSKAFVDFGITL